MSNQLFSRNLKLNQWLTGQSNMSEPSHRHKEAHSYHHVVLTQPLGHEAHSHARKRSHALQYATLGVGGLAVVSLVWWLNNSDAFYQDNQHLSLQENIANTLSQIPQSLQPTQPEATETVKTEPVATANSEPQPTVTATNTPSWSPWLYLNIQPGDTLLVIFERNHLNIDDMYQILEVAEYADNLHSLYPNQEVRIKRDANSGVDEMFAALDLNTELHIFRNDAGFGGEIMQFDEQSGRMQVVTDPKVLAEFGGEEVIVPKTQLSDLAPKTPVPVSVKTPVKLTEAEVVKANKDAKAAKAKEIEARKLAMQEAAKEKRLKAIAETNAKKTAREVAIKEALAKKEAAQKAAKLAAAEEVTAKKTVTHATPTPTSAEESAAKKAARIAAAEEAAARKAARQAAAEELAARRAEQQAAAEERAAAKQAEQQAAAEQRAARRAEQQAAIEERAAAKRAEQQAAAEERAAEQQRTAQLRQVALRQAQERQAAQEAAARQVAAITPQRAVRQEVSNVVSSVRQSFAQPPRQISALPSPVESTRPVSRRRAAASEVGTTVFDDVDSRYTSSSDPKLSKVLDSARGLVGTPYRFGGTTPKGFDCSGFVRYNARMAGAELPRTAREQYSATKAVDKEELRPGDLVFFNTRGRGVGHVGIYVGDNKFIHAPNKRKDVQVTSMNEKYYKQRYVRGGRF